MQLINKSLAYVLKLAEIKSLNTITWYIFNMAAICFTSSHSL